MMENELISVIIPNWNGRDKLKACLRSLERERERVPLETIVVDNGSTDDSVDMMEQRFPWVTRLINKTNRGFSLATNQGLRKSHGYFLCLLNNDTEIIDGALSILRRCLIENKAAGAAGGCLISSDGTPQISYGVFPTYESLLTRYLIQYQTPADRDRLERMEAAGSDIVQSCLNLGCVPSDAQSISEVDYISGACLMTRRNVIEDIGYLDESLFAYFEDTDWCFRAKRKGWRTIFNPAAKIIHHHSSSSTPIFKERIFLASMLFYIKKHFGWAAEEAAQAFLTEVFQDKIGYFRELNIRLPHYTHEEALHYFKVLFETIKEFGNHA